MWKMFLLAPCLMYCAGFGAKGVAQHMLPKIKDQLALPYPNPVVERLGFWCGVAGAGIITFGMALGWWDGRIIFKEP